MARREQLARNQNINNIVAYFESGIKPSTNAIGIELEHTLVHKNGDQFSYEDSIGTKWLLDQLKDKYNNVFEAENGELIGLSKGNVAITLEPAAQVEISAGPFTDLQKAKECFLDFEQTLKECLDPHKVDVLTCGYHPTQRAIDLELIPKERYRLMNEYLGAISMYGICMMRGSASTQVAIDYTSVEDCLRKLRLANACVPIFSLICDNSPIFEAAPRTHQLVRTKIWEMCDPDRCGTVPNVMDDGFSLQDYAEYILDTPAIFEEINGKYTLSRRTFGEIFADTPMTDKDIEHALSMFFTDIRLKTYIEIRPADAMPVEYVIAYAELVKGLFSSEKSLVSLEAIFANINESDIDSAKQSLMEHGYGGYAYGHPVSEITDELISIASNELDDTGLLLLEPIAKLVSKRITLADMAQKELT